MIGFLYHLLLPQESNNHRPKVLHHSSLFLLVFFLLLGSFFLTFISRSHPEVLGITANISTQDLLNLTNQKRIENGLSPVVLSIELTNASLAKGQDMLGKNYWAHNSPDGLTPWVFIKGAGYEYIYAGENLARGFTTAPEVVDAWMASPGHRENILSPNYKEIGFAVLTGTINDDETVLVVEEFGSRNLAGTPKEIAAASEVAITVPSPTQIVSDQAEALLAGEEAAVLTITPAQSPGTNLVAAIKNEPLVNKKTVTRNIPLLIVVFFILVLLLDMFIIERRKIDRVVGHNVDHIIFFTILLVAVIMIGKGLIL